MTEPRPRLKFPKNFLWGASTSAHQVEGNTHNQWSVWELENAKVLSNQAERRVGSYLVNWDRMKGFSKDPNNYVSGKLADHYNRYSEDFDYLQKMNMNAYRFSVEWSRIEPECGVWNAEAIDHYKNYVTELKNRGIEPIVTLFHFSLPVWFSEIGGFESRSNVRYFVRFAEKVISELGSSIKFIITVNEPEVYVAASYYNQDWPPMDKSILKVLLVTRNLSYAHKKVAKVIHKLSPRYKVSFAKHPVHIYPGDNALLSRLSTRLLQYFTDDIITNMYIKHCDFLGVNYYHSSRIFGYRSHNPDDKLSDLHWDMQPEHIQFVLERLYKKYRLPIMITENGLADSEDKNRKWWITQTIIGMQKAMKNGVKLVGYLHWSLMDNFEWAFGKWPRFGLVEVNYETGARTLRPSARWFGRVIKQIRGK